MAIDERSRHRLPLKLELVLGSEEASTLMAHLPPVGWADVATKRDLDQLQANFDLKLEAVESRIVGTLRDEFHSKIDSKIDSALRTLLIVISTLTVTLAGIAFAAARLT
ncbi:MAG TPA: hypothetical protein VF660_08380 [Actinomycetota bacterium]|jgi:hypothetical protein